MSISSESSSGLLDAPKRRDIMPGSAPSPSLVGFAGRTPPNTSITITTKSNSFHSTSGLQTSPKARPESAPRATPAPSSGAFSTSRSTTVGTPPVAPTPASRNVDLLVIRVASLENEINDTKRLLLDSICDKRDLEKQKDELVNVITELTGGQMDISVEEIITDRAKRTMMMLRMERTENMNKKLKAIIRVRACELQREIRHMKEDMQDFKSEVEQQMQRLGSVIDNGRSQYQELQEKLARDARRLAAAAQLAGSTSQLRMMSPKRNSCGDSNEGSYVDLVTAAVKEQQKSIVLPPDHPIILQLKVLFDLQDDLSNSLNTSWSAMRCFRDGKPPNLHQLRRFVDPLVNIKNYCARATMMKSFVEHADLMGILFNEMHLPQLERTTRRIITMVDRKLKNKIELAFEAMRVIRSPTSSGEHSMMNCIRLFSAAEGLPTHMVAEVNQRYADLAKTHTAKCFRYLRTMLQATVQYSKTPERNERLTDEQLFDLMPDPNAKDPTAHAGIINIPPAAPLGASVLPPGSPLTFQPAISVQAPGSPVGPGILSLPNYGPSLSAAGEAGDHSTNPNPMAQSVALKGGAWKPRCGSCNIPLLCEDCVSIETKVPEQKEFLDSRRQRILGFTEDRVLHLNHLCALIDDFLLVLRKARIISVDSFQQATRAGVTATAIRNQQQGQRDQLLGRSGMSRSVFGSPNQSRRERPTDMLASSTRNNFGAEQAALDLVHSTAVRSSTFYFEQLRKMKKVQEEIHNPLMVKSLLIPKAPGEKSRLGRSSIAVEGGGGLVRGSTAPASARPQPKAIPWSEPPKDEASQQRFLSDLDFLERLHRRQLAVSEDTPSPGRRSQQSNSATTARNLGLRGSLSSTPRQPSSQRASSGAVAVGKLPTSPRGPPKDPTTQQTRLGPLVDPSLIESLGKAMEYEYDE